ncbi:MAG: fumarylacetoacetate hydrolase family protein [Verrucomicrobia bacterium]|nr:fumarylacetoacetate hydrolase family protein [Verrucomicrobiota bacterium]
MKLYHLPNGACLEHHERLFQLPLPWDDLLNHDNLADYLAGNHTEISRPDAFLPVASAQEVWAAGVTYLRSKAARMEESASVGGGDFYDRVYDAPRPELFFKAGPHRSLGQGGRVRIRRDATWNVPEPELTLVINKRGHIIGYSIGNDMSSRDIEGENPLYLPQAKVYDGSCAIGPCVLVASGPLPGSTEIRMEIQRQNSAVFTGGTTVDRIKRPFPELAEYLYRELSFPMGCFLLTGTGIVPPNEFTLQSGDAIRITIPPIGTLENTVA